MKFSPYLQKSLTDTSLTLLSAFLGAIIGTQGLDAPMGKLGWGTIILIVLGFIWRAYQEYRMKSTNR